jgi:hypothetical protein
LKPIRVSQNETVEADKDWIACDNSLASPNYGHCYVEWDDSSSGDLIWMSTSFDGGQTWQPAKNTGDLATGLGGEPVVQPNGNVIVPIMGCTTSSCPSSMLAFTSINGGASWSSTIQISTITDHLVVGGLRSDPLPSIQVDGSGTVYVVWQDCRFRTKCSSNDLVISMSADGVTWSAPARIPIDATSSTVDHFIPGLGVDPATSGSTSHLGLVYYYYPIALCTVANCQLEAGFISSNDAGQTWTAAQRITIPMSLSWLPTTFSGIMVGDYMSTVFSGGKARPIFAVANQPGTGAAFNEAIYTTTNAFADAAMAQRFSAVNEQPVSGAHSDHAPRQFYDLEHRHPIAPPER